VKLDFVFVHLHVKDFQQHVIQHQHDHQLKHYFHQKQDYEPIQHYLYLDEVDYDIYVNDHKQVNYQNHFSW